MGQPERRQADDDQSTLGDATATVRTPGESSSSDARPASDAPTMVDLEGSNPGPSSPPRITPVSSRKTTNEVTTAGPVLQPGSLLGQRYRILEILGQGGMGAVYKALDLEVNQVVALKVIRPDLAGNPAIIERFKQELILARQITHRNVIRIFDLAEADGVKFITMEFVAGEDLRSLIHEKKKVPPEEAVEIMRQVCRALEAAHSAGVIHRDLKPQNIMRENTGRVVVMDFGLARTLEGTGMTQTGAMIGTLEYMSPEQALGKELDQRSDLFAVGLIFYELLIGKMPFHADSALASLIKRTQQHAAPVSDEDNSIPGALSGIVSKCLEREVNLRYQSATELLADLELWQGKRAAATLTFPAVGMWGKGVWQWIGVAAVVVALVLTGIVLRGKFTKSNPVANKAITVLVADFNNHTGDPVFDGTLEPMFNRALEGASFINSYSRETARKLARKLPHPSDKLDEQAARLVAASQAVSTIVTGEISRRGDKYNVSAMALDVVTGNVLANAEVSAENKEDTLREIPKLAAPIRKALGDTTPASVQYEANAGAFNTSSLEAFHLEALGVEEQFAAKWEDAFQSFSKAVQLDPNFALAYSGMAAMAGNLGRRQDAEKYTNLALAHGDRMTERERYRARGLYYMTIGNWQKCVEEYDQLINRYPADRVGQANLALCYGQLRNIPKAFEAARRAVEIVPKGAVQRLNLAFLSCLIGDFPNGEQEAREALQLSPSAEGYLISAEAQFGQGQLSQAEDTYRNLEKFSALGASMGSTGLADLYDYEGRFADAVKVLEQGAAADLDAKNSENAARKLVALGRLQLLRGQRRLAIAATDKAVTLHKGVPVRFQAAQIFVDGGEVAKAQQLAASLGSELAAEPQAYAKIIEGRLGLKKDPHKAITKFTEANKLLDTWIGHFELGRAYLEIGAFVDADSEFDRCIKRRGEAMELFMDNVPTFGYFPGVYYLQGRVRQGLKSPGFAESYRNYLTIRGQSAEDSLVAEIHRQLGK